MGRLPTPDEMMALVSDLEARLTADVASGREELRHLFRNGRIDRRMRSFRSLILAALCTTSLLSSTHRSAAQETPTPESWRPGQSVPDGYRARKPKDGLTVLILGGSLFILSYAPILIYGGLESLACASYAGQPGGCSLHNPGFEMIPLVGPFLYATENGGSPLAMLDGILQVSGVGVAVIGAAMFVSAKPVLVPETASHKNEPLKLRVLPMIGANANGVTILGTF